MNITSRVPSPARVSTGRQRLYAGALAAFLLVVLTGCPSGYVQTESGATVAASTVHAQDLVGNALSVVQDVHNGAVAAHDAKAGQEPADVHAARRSKLLASAAGLRSGWDGLSAWKAGTEGVGMVAVVSRLRDALPGLLTVAVELKLVSQEYADAIGVFFGTASRGIAPEPLKKQTVVSVLIPAREHGEALDAFHAVVQPVDRGFWRQGVQTLEIRGPYFDGCNWHTPLSFGGESVTAMGCGYSAQLVTAPLTSTLEVRR